MFKKTGKHNKDAWRAGDLQGLFSILTEIYRKCITNSVHDS